MDTERRLPELIIKVGAMGGSISVWSVNAMDGSRSFLVKTDESTLKELMDEEDAQGLSFESETAPLQSFADALTALGRYSWHKLHPIFLHQDFVDRVLTDVVRRGGENEANRWRQVLGLKVEYPMIIDTITRITYASWSEFEEKESAREPLRKSFMPIAKNVHDLIISTFNENKMPFKVRYGVGTFSFSVPQDLAKSRKRTCVRFGLLNFKMNSSYIQGLYKDAAVKLPEGAKLHNKEDPTMYFYSFSSLEDFEKVKKDLKEGIVRSYNYLSQEIRRQLVEDVAITIQRDNIISADTKTKTPRAKSKQTINKSGDAKSQVVAKVTKANRTNAASGSEANLIPAIFARYFDHWHITLPDDAVKTQLPGKIQLSGWYIQYKFGSNDRGKYLDFYASHRMTNDRHLRIYASGETESLSAISDIIFYPANATPEQEAEIRKEDAERNKRVWEALKKKGFE